jgi:3-oxoacyl-[acyl-carrier protein] reductase
MKHILITGASTGIGAASAKELAEGNTIYIHYNHSEEEAQQVAEEVRRREGTPVLLKADLSTDDGCTQLAREVERQTDSLDLLVNNAGGLLGRHSIEETSWEIAQATFELNVFSAMRLTALLTPLVRKGQEPLIIYITSVAARTGSPSATTYAASKGALDTYTRGVARALAPDVRVNAIAPGIIFTPFHEKSTSEEQMRKFMNAIPLERGGEPEEIARAVRFIMETPFMTGETVDINGGMYMR